MAERAHVALEEALRRRVVQIDRVLVREQELDVAERVVVARRLADHDLARVDVAPVDHLRIDGAVFAVDIGEHLVALAGHVARVAAHGRQHFLHRDRGRHVPARIDDNRFHRVGEDRGLVGDLADHGAGGVDDLAVLDDADAVFRDVRDDVELAEVARHPAPALHVGDDLGRVRFAGAVDEGDRGVAGDAVGRQTLVGLEALHRLGERLVVDLGRLARGGQVEAGAQQRHARIGEADLHRLAFRHRSMGRRALGAARLGERLLQAEVALVLRIVRSDRRRAVGRRRDGGQHLDRIGQERLQRDQLADRGRIEAAGIGLARIGEDRLAEQQVDGSGDVGAGRRGRADRGRRQLVGGGIESVLGGGGDPGHDLAGLGGVDAIDHPDRLVVALGVELDHGGAVALVVERGLGLGLGLGEQGLQGAGGRVAGDIGKREARGASGALAKRLAFRQVGMGRSDREADQSHARQECLRLQQHLARTLHDFRTYRAVPGRTRRGWCLAPININCVDRAAIHVTLPLFCGRWFLRPPRQCRVL